MKLSTILTLLLATGLAVPAYAQTTGQDAGGAPPAGNAEQGAKDFIVCKACHQIGPGAKNAVGPVLNGVVGRKAGTYPGYSYSKANQSSGITWTPEELNKYLDDPQKVVPGTKMAFAGVHDEKKRANIIAYLSQFNEDGSKKQ